MCKEPGPGPGTNPVTCPTGAAATPRWWPRPALLRQLHRLPQPRQPDGGKAPAGKLAPDSLLQNVLIDFLFIRGNKFIKVNI